MEFEKSTEQNVQSGEQEGVVGLQQSSTEESGASQESVVGSRNADFAMVDTDSGETVEEQSSNPDGAGQDGVKQQTREENAAIRAARIRAQRDAEAAAMARAAARTDAEIANSGVINPYTGKPFSSMKEFKEYGDRTKKAELAKQARETGRSVEDLTEEDKDRAFVRARRKAEETSAAIAERARPQKQFLDNDVLDFVEKHPEFGVKELETLENNQKFRKFCGSRFGREPLADLYEAYMELLGDAGTAAVAKAASRQRRSTGSGTAGNVVLSPAQKSALDKWNAEYPEMAMTAKEFLGR